MVTLTRRDLMKLLLATAIAEAVDVEQLLWVPKPIVTVPTMPFAHHNYISKVMWDETGEIWRSIKCGWEEMNG